MARRGTRLPPLVPRTQLTVRLPLAVHEEIRVAAGLLGVAVNVWVVQRLAEVLAREREALRAAAGAAPRA